MANILVIDDDNDILQLLDAVLKTQNHQVALVDSARDGLKLLQHRLFDIVVTDILMPDIDGIELIGIIKATYPGTKVLAISGGGSNRTKFLEYLPVAQRLGADNVLPKPFDVHTLLSVVASMLHERQ